MKLLAIDTATEGTREPCGEGPARGSRDRRQGERVQRFGFGRLAVGTEIVS